jgi:hypothetical protein
MIESAHAQHIPALEYILDLAYNYSWDESETVAVLAALARHTRHERTRPEPQPLADILAQANEFADDLDAEEDRERIPALEIAVANYTSAAWAAAQTDDPGALEAVEHWTGAIAEVIGLDGPPIPDTDPVRQRLEAAVTIEHLTDEQANEVLAILTRAGY